MAKDQQMKERRRKTAAMIYRGMKKKTVWETIADEYDVDPDTVRIDWYKRDEWMPELFNLDSPGKMVLDIVNNHKEIMDRLWEITRGTENENVELGALKEIRKVNQDVLDMLQSVGAVHQVAEELHIVTEDTEDIDEISAVDKLQNKLQSLNTGQDEDEDDDEEVIDVEVNEDG